MSHFLRITLTAGVVAVAACARSQSEPPRAEFDPLDYPGDSALTCDAITAGGTKTVALQFTGVEASPTLQRRITAIFDADGSPRVMDLLVPEPGRRPPRAHWLRVQFQPAPDGSHAVVDSGGGESLQSIMRAADAAATPLGESEMNRAEAYMRRLWTRQCNGERG